MQVVKSFRKKILQPMRPYVTDEDMTGITVTTGVTPEVGGMVAINPVDTLDMWYITPQVFNATYEETPVVERESLNFPSALTYMTKSNEKVARLVWGEDGSHVYALPSGGVYMHVAADGSESKWPITQEDIAATDWYILTAADLL